MTAPARAETSGGGSAALAELLAALDEGDEQPLRAWLAAAGVDAEAVRSLPQWNVASSPGALAEAMSRAAHKPYGVALLMIYLLTECENTWEESYHYGPIWAALRQGARWREYVPGVTGADATAAAAVQVLLEMVDQEIQVENAMTSGRLAGFGQAAEALVAQARNALRLAESALANCPEIGEFVAGRAGGTGRYYSAAAAAGHALRRFLAESGYSLTGAIGQLADAETGGGIEPNRISELRAHRFSLQALQEDVERPWLHVNSGKIIYVYPFAVRGTPATLARRAAGEGGEWDLAGVVPAAVHGSFNLNDVWDGTDLFGRAYDGTQLVLPGLTMHDLAGDELVRLTAEVRLSNIGNHYLRLEAALSDADPQDVYSAMFRAAPEHGTAVVSVEGAQRTWPRLSDFAQDICTAVAARLDGLPAGGGGPAGGERDEELARRGAYHVMVVVEAASVSTGPVGPRREVRTDAEVVAAVGAQVLMNPVTHCVSALAEWSRYPVHERTNILGSVTHRDDMVLRTANTTVFVALGSPSFHTRTRETVAEFVASLEGLFAGWSAELTSYYHEVDTLLYHGERLDESATAAQVRESVAALRNMQQQLNAFIADTRSTVALIESPALVASPVVSTMKAGLLEAAGFRQRAEELDRQVEQVLGNRLVDRIEETVRRLAQRMVTEEEERQRRQRARMDTALAVIAAVGISGLGQIIQAGYDVRDFGALWITATILTMAILFGVGIRWANRDSRARASRAAAVRQSAGGADAGDPPTPGPREGAASTPPAMRRLEAAEAPARVGE